MTISQSNFTRLACSKSVYGPGIEAHMRRYVSMGSVSFGHKK